MSIREEKINALKMTREFLRELLDPKKTPKVPKSIRKHALSCLRHWPNSWDVKIKNDPK